jgi:hypothetical protein
MERLESRPGRGANGHWAGAVRFVEYAILGMREKGDLSASRSV